MNPRLTMRRHGRKIAVVGALVAVSAITTMALVAGTAAAAPSATQPGKCVDNVNVRSEPSTTSKIVAVCETGKAVQVAETRNGFVHLTDLKGWAAQEFVSVDGKTPPTPASRATRTTPSATAAPGSGSDAGSRPTGERATPRASGDDTGTSGSGDTAGDDTSAPDGSDMGAADQGADDQGADDQGSGDQSDQSDQGAAAPSPLGGLLG